MRRSTLRVLMSRISERAAPGYFRHPAPGERCRLAIPPRVTPSPADAVALAARVVRP
jgi:hypothetical protein